MGDTAAGAYRYGRNSWDSFQIYMNLVWNTNFFTWLSDVRRAEYERELTRLQLRLAREEHVRRCLELYYDILRADGENALAAHGLGGDQGKFAAQENASAKGLLARAEGEAARDERDARRLDLAEKTENRDQRLQELKMALDLPHRRRLLLTFSAEKMSAPPLAVCLERARAHNAAIATAILALRLLEEAEKSVHLARWTDIRAYLSLPSLPLTSGSRPYSQEVLLGLNWSIPLYDGGEIGHRLAELAVEKRRLALQSDETLRRLHLDITRQHQLFFRIQARIALARRILNRKERALSCAIAERAAGLRSEADVIGLRHDVEEQNFFLVTLQQKQQFCWFHLQLLMGDMAL